MTTKPLTLIEERHIETVTMWLDSMKDWFALLVRDDDPPLLISSEAPTWVRTCVERLDRTLFAPPNAVLNEPGVTPYAAGYALGIMRWGVAGMQLKTPREVRIAYKSIRLSKKARRQLVRMWQDFLISVQILTRKHGRLRLAFARELNLMARTVAKYTGHDESEFHRGLAGGLRGVGHGVPGDRSNDATKVYLVMVVWWRFVARFDTVTQLHRWLCHALGPSLAGERKRTEKICERIGLTFRLRGRPKKNPTLLLPG